MRNVIIAGAGIIGLACAWRLAQKGIGVIIFDSGQCAREASWAAAGMLAPGGEFSADSPLARIALLSAAQYPAFVQELEDASGSSIDYRRCGAIEVAFSPGEAEQLARRVACQAVMGIRSEPYTWAGSLAARFYPDEAIVNPRDVTAALRSACMKAGVMLHENEPVTEIIGDGSGVRTIHGEYHASGVLIAAGAWSAALHPGLQRTTPVRGHLIGWSASPGVLGTILRDSHTYLLQRRNGLLIAGSSTEYAGFDRTIDEDIVAGIQARAIRLMPALAGMTPAERWNGLRPAIEGEIPAVGRVDGTAIWIAFGHYRNGILLAPDTAQTIATSVAASQPFKRR